MKIAIKVCDIAALLNFNNFKSKELILRTIKSRIYKSYNFNIQPSINTSDIVNNIIETFTPQTDDIQLEDIETMPIVYKEFNNFYIYCLKHELNVKDAVLIDRKLRISQKVKNFIPMIDLVHIQFYLLLSNCRRCLLDEVWDDGFVRKCYIRYDEDKINQYINQLNNVILDII